MGTFKQSANIALEKVQKKYYNHISSKLIGSGANMNNNEFTYIKEVAKQKSFSKASKALGIIPAGIKQLH